MPSPDEDDGDEADDNDELHRSISRAGWLMALGCIVGIALLLIGGFPTFALVAAGASGCATDCNDKPLGLYFAACVLGFGTIASSVIAGRIVRARLRKRLNAISR
jgi:hypothetical protein